MRADGSSLIGETRKDSVMIERPRNRTTRKKELDP
jgi:hypothetical protein